MRSVAGLAEINRLSRFALRQSVVAFLLALVLASAAFSQVEHIQNAARLLDQGQLNKAEAEAREALNSPATRALALSLLGTIRVQQGKYQEGEHFLTKALGLDPHLVGARITLGEDYVLENKLPQARNSFELALQRDPSNFNARYDLAKVESSLHHFKESLDVSKPIEAQLTNSDEGLLLLATNYGMLARKDELRRIYEEWQKLPQPPSDDVAIDFAAALNSAGLSEEAKAVLRATGASIQRHFSSRLGLRLARAYLSVGDWENAAKYSQTVLSLNADCADCNLMLGEAAEQQGISEKALAYLIQAKKQDPENPEILFEFGRVSLRRDLVKDAVPALEKAAALRPDQDSYIYVLASAHVADGNLAKAASLLLGLLQKHPEDAVLNYAMGTVYYLQAKFPEAETSLKRSLKLKPDQVAASYYLALTYQGKGDDDQAASLFREVIKRQPDHGPAYVKLGTILVRERQYDEARDDLEKAVSLVPDSVEAHYQLGMVLRRLGNVPESQDQFAQSRKLQDEHHSRMRLQLLLPD